MLVLGGLSASADAGAVLRIEMLNLDLGSTSHTFDHPDEVLSLDGSIHAAAQPFTFLIVQDVTGPGGGTVPGLGTLNDAQIDLTFANGAVTSGSILLDIFNTAAGQQEIFTATLGGGGVIAPENSTSVLDFEVAAPIIAADFNPSASFLGIGTPDATNGLIGTVFSFVFEVAPQTSNQNTTFTFTNATADAKLDVMSHAPVPAAWLVGMSLLAASAGVRGLRARRNTQATPDQAGN